MHRLPTWLFPVDDRRRGHRVVTGHGVAGAGVVFAAWLVLTGALSEAGIRTSSDLLGANVAVVLGLVLAVTTLRRAGAWVSPERVTVVGAFGLWSRSCAIDDVAQVFVIEPKWRQAAMVGLRLKSGRVLRASAVCAPQWGSTEALVERGEDLSRLVAAARAPAVV